MDVARSDRRDDRRTAGGSAALRFGPDEGFVPGAATSLGLWTTNNQQLMIGMG